MTGGQKVSPGLPELGDFGHQVMLGPFEPNLERLLPHHTPHGLVLDAGWIYSQFRDEDGNILNGLRKVAGYWTGGLMINTNLQSEQLTTHPTTAQTYAGGLEIDYDEDQVTWHSPVMPGASTPQFSYTQTLEGCTWHEEGVLDITGKLMRPGMQWYDAKPGAGGLYALHVIQAEGTFLGKRVKGWFGYDFIYLPAHTPWHVSPYPTRLEVAYHTLANEYDDGSVEVGMICYGLEGWTFAIMSDGENLTHCCRDVDVQIVRQPDGFPGEVLYSFDDVQYHWKPDPRGKLIERAAMYDGAYRGSEGHCQRVGDNRKIVNGQGWIDFFADDRVEGKLVNAIDFGR